MDNVTRNLVIFATLSNLGAVKGEEFDIMANSKLQAIWNHPAGPKTKASLSEKENPGLRFDLVHFWAPTFKWGLTIANILDSSKPPEDLSYAQQSDCRRTGILSVSILDVSNCPVSTVTHDSSAKNQQASAEEE
ncbi:hypothetical protein Prudu_009799 [Prunus dulcis]|uniref:Mitochondrial pyruvate carrier n=1 Tax=Prunus dulcis TaxID=3755 RepID=A0A4Y1R6W4_PRUDU|nr:hypothetical protein Prudu_009799 [Prunus dulcis]